MAPKGWARVPKNLELLDEASETDLAYMAGIIDGEGSVSIWSTRRNANARNDGSAPAWVLEVVVVNTDKTLIDWCEARFGGSSNLRRRPPEKSFWKDVYRWRCSGIHAEALLRRVRPWLIIKASQADLAFEFRSTFHNGRRPTAEDIGKRQAIVDGLRAERDHRKDPAGVAA